MDLTRYMELFQGRRDVFAQQYTDGSWSPVRRPITPSDYEDHLRGEITYGIYPITNINSTKLICFDIDTMGADPRMELHKALNELRIGENQRILEMSGRKGFHLWLPFQHWAPAGVAYRAGQAVLQRAGIEKMEVYPKQESLDRDKPLGNLIKLPLGIHRVSGQPSRLLGRWTKVQPLASTQIKRLASEYQEAPRPVYQPVAGDKMDAFGRNVLTRECAKVAEAQDGGRNDQLNRSAYTLYGLVASGVLDEGDVYDNLTNAAAAAGLGMSETIKTMASAKAAGMRRPMAPSGRA